MHIIKRDLQLRALVLRARRLLDENLLAACRLQGIELKLRLLILGADTSVTDKHVKTSRNPCKYA